jgi:hypothetical protein
MAKSLRQAYKTDIFGLGISATRNIASMVRAVGINIFCLFIT